MPPPAIRSSASSRGAEFNLNIKADGTAALYTGAAGQTLVLDNIQLAYSTDHHSIEFAIPKTALGSPSAVDALYDVNDNRAFGPANYSAQPYVVYHDLNVAPTHRVAIVYSDTSADLYFNPDRLFRSVHGGAEPGPDGRRVV